MIKKVELLKEIKNRKSPLIFKDKDVEKEKINILIEAARWAPSCFNNQPWKYVFVHKKDKNRKAVERALMPGNGWAKKAPYLVIIGVNSKDDCQFNDVDYSLYDTGLSVMSLTIEAEHQGLSVHQMAGYFKVKIKKAVDFPDSYKVVVVFALGYKDSAKNIRKKMTEKIKNKMAKSRTRNDISKNFFFNHFKK